MLTHPSPNFCLFAAAHVDTFEIVAVKLVSPNGSGIQSLVENDSMSAISLKSHSISYYSAEYLTESNSVIFTRNLHAVGEFLSRK